MNEARHNCLAGEHYPKRTPTFWSDEKGQPKNFTISLVLLPIPIFMIVILSFGVYEVATFDQEEYQEHVTTIKEQYREMSCENLAMLIAGDTLTTGLLGDRYTAEREYGYECLGKDRPEPKPVTNSRDENPRGIK